MMIFHSLPIKTAYLRNREGRIPVSLQAQDMHPQLDERRDGKRRLEWRLRVLGLWSIKQVGLIASLQDRIRTIIDIIAGLSINLLLLLFLTHLCYPRARHHTRKFFELSYYNESRDRYALGWDDIFLVFHWIVVFTGLRAATMDYILSPLAQWAGLNKKKEKVRFAEQAWVLIYYGVFWSLGMV
jgi:hypothetical protein